MNLSRPTRAFTTNQATFADYLELTKPRVVASIKLKCEELGLDAPASSHGRLLEDVKALALRHKRLVSDDEFRTLVHASA